MFEAVRQSTIIPERFQENIIRSATSALLQSDTPCLLRAPTASGKTLMLGRIAEALSKQLNMTWLWFVPFGFLVNQTIASIFDNCAGLHPLALATERQRDLHPGDVLVSGIMTVAAADKGGRNVYKARDFGLPSLGNILGRARSRGMRIGVIIDEAHIAVSEETEFGKFCKALMPDRILLATATPRDSKLNAFVRSAGYGTFTSFTVSRDDVVDVGLNKRYVEAHVFKVASVWAGITDIKRTALKAAWAQHLLLRERLTLAGITTVPLMLVQIENGASSDEITKFLVNSCGVPHMAIGEHTSDAPDPKLMASIANNTRYEVLIFKESAGTGFDAPRAFVLVTMKHVVDAEYATQFLGRIMRVERAVRAELRANPTEFDSALDTGYLYLANISAQLGFEKSVAALQALTTDADGVTEELRCYAARDGSVVVTNRPMSNPGLPLNYPRLGDLPDLPTKPSEMPLPGQPGSFVGTLLDAVPIWPDIAAEPLSTTKQSKLLSDTYRDGKALDIAAMAAGLRVYRLRSDIKSFTPSLLTEQRPAISDLALVARTVASLVNYDRESIAAAVTVALRGVDTVERITELMAHETTERGFRGVFDPRLLSREAGAVLQSLQQMEEADRRIFLETLSARLAPDVVKVIEIFDDASRPRDEALTRLVRNVTNILIRRMGPDIQETYHRAMADAVKVIDAATLPDALCFPVTVPLLKAHRNIYGVFPPSVTDGRAANHQLLPHERRLLEGANYLPIDVKPTPMTIAYADSTHWANKEEEHFSRSLDDADFVYWWHRNPPRKPYSSAVVRADGGNFFPDFIISLSTFAGDTSRTRMIETKESIKDAVRKMKRSPRTYGKVVFITKDGEKYRLVDEQGQMGAVVDDTLESLRDELRKTSEFM